MVIISTLEAAVLNVLLNLMLIPPFAAIGAAVSTLISEFAVLVVQIKLGRQYIPFKFFDKHIVAYLLATVLMSVGIFSCMYFSNIWWQMLCGSALGALIYISVLYLSKDEVLKEVLKMVRQKF